MARNDIRTSADFLIKILLKFLIFEFSKKKLFKRLPDDGLKSVLWMSDDCLITVQWQPDDSLMTAWCLSYDCLMTVQWLPDDCPMSVWWLSNICLMILRQFSVKDLVCISVFLFYIKLKNHSRINCKGKNHEESASNWRRAIFGKPLWHSFR